MLFNKNIKYRDVLILALAIAFGYIIIENYTTIFLFIKGLISILSPFIYALVIAYCLNPLMKFFERSFRLKRGVSVALTYLFVIGIVVFVFVYFMPNIVESIISITSEVPKYMEIVQNWVNNELKKENLYYIINDFGLLNHLSVLSSKLGALLINALENSIASLFLVTSSLIKILLGLLISVYVLFDKEKLVEGSKTLIYMTIKEDKGKKLIEWLKIYHNMVGLYIGTKALDSFIIGVLAFIGLVIINAPYSALLALIVGVTNMVPYLGPLIGEVIGGIMGLFISPMMGLTVFVFLFVLQQFDAWYLDPKLIGNKVGVKPFFILIALAIGGGYFGVIGMLLASPTIATLKIAYDRKVAKFIVNNGHLLKHIEINSMKSSTNTIKLENKKTEEDGNLT